MIKKSMSNCRSDCLYCSYNTKFASYKYMTYVLGYLGIEASRPDHADVLLYDIAGHLMCI